MRNQASLTAEYMALFRALESIRSPRLFTDPFAPLFLEEWRRRFLQIARIPGGRFLVERVLDRGAPGARASGIARTRWIDDEVTVALATIPQLVLLGAGYDTRGLRLDAARHATVFELDHPETSRAKQARLRTALGTLPPHVRFVPIDFNRQAAMDALVEAGFDLARPAGFIWEGVTNYLPAEAIDATFAQLRRAAPGSVLLFTYTDRAVLDHPERFLGAQTLLARLEQYGEPWIFGWYPSELTAYLDAHGFELFSELSVADVWQRAGRPAGEMRGYEFYRLAAARLR